MTELDKIKELLDRISTKRTPFMVAVKKQPIGRNGKRKKIKLLKLKQIDYRQSPEA